MSSCETLLQAEPRHIEVLGQLLHASKIVAEKEGIVDGFRVVINNGAEGCKSFPSNQISSYIGIHHHYHTLNSLNFLSSRPIRLPSASPRPWGPTDEVATWLGREIHAKPNHVQSASSSMTLLYFGAKSVTVLAGQILLIVILFSYIVY